MRRRWRASAASTIAPPRTPSPPSAPFCAACKGDCKTPLAAHAVVDGAKLRIEGLVGAPDGSKLLRHALEGTTEDAAAVGHALAEELLRQGADRLLGFTTSELVGGE